MGFKTMKSSIEGGLGVSADLRCLFESLESIFLKNVQPRVCVKNREQDQNKHCHYKTASVCFENLNRRALHWGPLACCLAVQKYARQEGRGVPSLIFVVIVWSSFDYIKSV